ncbi:hypothetical protein [Streptomyces sp. NPDC005012]|uniref:hypothetical protein n=1 Tax=Streptomyces sp. NPDC005012 TaxID=3154558 RepID=UPI0033A21065
MSGFVPALLLSLAGGLTACGPPGDDVEASPSSSPANKGAGHCRELIGPDGITWSEKAHGAAIAESARDVQAPGEAVDRFLGNARSWTSGTDDNYFLRPLPAVCRLVPEGVMSADGPVTVKLGPGTFPFEELTAGDTEKGGRVRDVGSDVKLVAWAPGEDRGNRNSVYVKCRVEGALPGQEERVALEVTMTDRLAAAGTAARFDLLLDAARVMVEKAGCLNGPELPERAPEG